MKNQRLFIFCGIPFAGKTTLAKELGNALKIPRIDLDEVKFDLLGKDVKEEQISQEQWNEVFAEMYKRIDLLLRKGNSVIHDTGNFTRDERKRVQEISEKMGISFTTIFVDIPYEVALERWQRNQDAPTRFQIDRETFEDAVKELEIPNETENTFVLKRPEDLEILKEQFT